MNSRRVHILMAGALMMATAVAGAVARAGSRAPAPAVGPRTTHFVAPGSGPVSFTGTLDRTAVLRGQDGLTRIELAMAAAADEPKRHARRPTDVVVIFDRSGSMSGSKIEHARAAVYALLAELGAHDRVALVTYSDSAALTIPLSAADERQRAQWRAAVSDIQPNGGTNMASGLDLGLDVVERARADGRVPHVILISDGLANQGDATPGGLTGRARRAAQGEYMLSSIGVGSDFDADLMTAIANAGTGNYYYVHDPRELSGVFAREFDAARTTVATGLSVQIEPGAGVRVIDAAGYPLEAAGTGVVFRPGSLFAGQQRRIWVTLAVPHHAIGEYDLGRFSLAYGAPHDRQILGFSETPRVACVGDADQFYANVDVGAWSRSVIVDGYNKMQEEVARQVKAGRRDEALQRLRQFKDETAAMNTHLRSAPVAAQLDSADQLESEVAGAFQGADQARRQNELSKSAGAEAVDSRRVGAKK
jgi:Ca-activated chloride channel family protein